MWFLPEQYMVVADATAEEPPVPKHTSHQSGSDTEDPDLYDSDVDDNVSVIESHMTDEEAWKLAKKEGLHLETSERSKTGYKGVYFNANSTGHVETFRTEVKGFGHCKRLGVFVSRVAAALAVARYWKERLSSDDSSKPLSSQDGLAMLCSAAAKQEMTAPPVPQPPRLEDMDPSKKRGYDRMLKLMQLTTEQKRQCLARERPRIELEFPCLLIVNNHTIMRYRASRNQNLLEVYLQMQNSTGTTCRLQTEVPITFTTTVFQYARMSNRTAVRIVGHPLEIPRSVKFSDGEANYVQVNFECAGICATYYTNMSLQDICKYHCKRVSPGMVDYLYPNGPQFDITINRSKKLQSSSKLCHTPLDVLKKEHKVHDVTLTTKLNAVDRNVTMFQLSYTFSNRTAITKHVLRSTPSVVVVARKVNSQQ